MSEKEAVELIKAEFSAAFIALCEDKELEKCRFKHSENTKLNGKALSLLFVFDEGQPLLKPQKLLKQKLFEHLRRSSVFCMMHDSRFGIFSVILDTVSRFVGFLPSAKPDPSHRLSIGTQLFPPIYLLQFWYLGVDDAKKKLKELQADGSLYSVFADKSRFSQWLPYVVALTAFKDQDFFFSLVALCGNCMQKVASAISSTLRGRNSATACMRRIIFSAA
jgi:hypothetical protein